MEKVIASVIGGVILLVFYGWLTGNVDNAIMVGMLSGIIMQNSNNY